MEWFKLFGGDIPEEIEGKVKLFGRSPTDGAGRCGAAELGLDMLDLFPHGRRWGKSNEEAQG